MTTISSRLTRPAALAVALLTLLALLLPMSGAEAASRPTYDRGDRGSKVTELQKRLKSAGVMSASHTGYFGPATEGAVKRFQGKFALKVTGRADPKTFDRLVGVTRRGEALDKRCLTGRVVCIDKTQKVTRLVRDGKTVLVFDARFGRRGMETREGRFSINRKSRNHVSSIYGSPMPYALFFSGGQAVHYSPDFAKKGYNGASHGCVNLRDRAGAAKLFDSVRTGDRVIVYRS